MCQPADGALPGRPGADSICVGTSAGKVTFGIIILDVECHNKGALQLYEKCGSDIQQAYNFWRLEVDVMESRWSR